MSLHLLHPKPRLLSAVLNHQPLRAEQPRAGGCFGGLGRHTECAYPSESQLNPSGAGIGHDFIRSVSSSEGLPGLRTNKIQHVYLRMMRLRPSEGLA